MRSFMLLSFAPLLFAALMGVQGAPTGTDDLDDCAPATTVQAREFLEGILERRTPKAVSTAALAFINHLKTNSATLTKAPVFWTGRNGRKGAKQVADILKKDTSIVGSSGGFTVFDALKDAQVPDAETAKWKPATDWRAVCGAFAQYAKPTGKKAHLVYGPTYDQTHNIWADDEWPALQQNTAVTQVMTYEMKADGKTWTDKGEIKASKKGSPVHSANSSPQGSDHE
ncbi:hypothetical protein J3R30DRAFT_3733582 [Lentinula aciculospora]|uniref:Uncharacterized protein n=1 Tax=Lentinula aciculospora TaxID=153920 RepID=A0A9W9DNU1_9AGAR|nr:hypothetical protein J3R30DRAFT_3733582 [Lentinula aciculospora]